MNTLAGLEMKKVCAFSPGHITGFFQICDGSMKPLEKGSRGAGVSISKGVTTTVEAKPARSSIIHIEINGNSSIHAPVSEAVIARFLEYKRGQKFDIHVSHDVGVPIGSGFGTSGAGALSLALALNSIMDCDLTRIEAAQIAHIVEVEQRTGLGTVIAEMVGGIEIRSIAGGPGVGRVEVLPSSRDLKVVCLPFGPISTSKHLNNPESRKRINERGGLLTDALRGHPTVSNFMEYSRHFAEHIGILTERVNAVLEETDEAGYTCSTAIFGENVFSLVPPDQVPELVAIFNRHKIPESYVLILEIDYEGARVLNAPL
jgi:pantoate kinase